MTREELQAERDDLARKLKARERAGGGYAKNLVAIQARMDAIDAEILALDD